MDNTEKLLAIEDIKRLKARYCRTVDAKDWAGYRALFADDVHFDISDDMPDGIFSDPDTATKNAAAGLSGVVSVHHCHCPEIDIESPTRATGIWAMEDMLRWSPESAYPGQTLHGYGHYIETYTKLADRWVIQTLKLRRMRVDVLPGAAS